MAAQVTEAIALVHSLAKGEQLAYVSNSQERAIKCQPHPATRFPQRQQYQSDQTLATTHCNVSRLAVIVQENCTLMLHRN
jgi:hypothetical protein